MCSKEQGYHQSNIEKSGLCDQLFQEFKRERKRSIEKERDRLLMERFDSEVEDVPSPTLLFQCTMEAVESIPECKDEMVWRRAWNLALVKSGNIILDEIS